MPASTRRIYVDANVLLAYLGNETGHAEIVQALLDEARRSEIEIITSVLSIAEVAFGAQERDAGLTPEGEAQIDTLYHFFQDAYHLKDWIKHDTALGGGRPDAEDAISRSVVLKIGADICNGSKHLTVVGRLPPRTGDLTTAVVSQSVRIYVGAGTEHSWIIQSNGKPYDAHALSAQIVAAWDTWLLAAGLLP